MSSVAHAPLAHARKGRRSRRLRVVLRWSLLALGFLLIGVGFVGALLPGHLGLPVMVVGLAVVLRNSRTARRRFVKLQRRHPRWVFPLRRILRSPRAIVPVMWQALLRTERFFLRRWRLLAKLRRRWLRNRQGGG